MPGNDRIAISDAKAIGGAGDDVIVAASAWATAVYWDAPRGVVVDLGAGTAEDGYGGLDRLVGIRVVHGSGFDEVRIQRAHYVGDFRPPSSLRLPFPTFILPGGGKGRLRDVTPELFGQAPMTVVGGGRDCRRYRLFAAILTPAAGAMPRRPWSSSLAAAPCSAHRTARGGCDCHADAAVPGIQPHFGRKRHRAGLGA